MVQVWLVIFLHQLRLENNYMSFNIDLSINLNIKDLKQKKTKNSHIMNIEQLIANHYKEFCWGSVFLYSTIKLIKNIILRSQYMRRFKNIEKNPILTLQQVVKIAQQKQSSQTNNNSTFLIKLQPQTSRKLFECKKEIRSNQFWLVQPSLNKISRQISTLFNKSFIEKNEKATRKLERQNIWIERNIKQKQLFKLSQKTQINGIGQILDHEIFNIKYRYEPHQKKGFFTRFHQGLAYYIQFLFFGNTELAPLSENQNRRPFIKGPIIGNIFYIFQFIQNRKILIEAKIQNGQIFAIANAGSKQTMLLCLNKKIWHSNMQIAFFLAIAYLTYQRFRRISRLLPKIKRKVKTMIESFKNKQKIFVKEHCEFRLGSSIIGENNFCIICYTNCRNVILFNCRHIIMCDECKEVYKDNSCPLCKKEIEQHKLLYKD